MFIRAAGEWDTLGMIFKCPETLQALVDPNGIRQPSQSGLKLLLNS